jgi:hypothetical protein
MFAIVTNGTIAINNHMVLILVHIDIIVVEDVLIDGRAEVNIITNKLWVKLGLPKHNHAPYNSIPNHIVTRLIGLIKDLEIQIYGIHSILH